MLSILNTHSKVHKHSKELRTTGFASPASDYREDILDFNSYLISNKAATIVARLEGDSYEKIGLFDNDILIIDRSKKAKWGDLSVIISEGEFKLIRLLPDKLTPDTAVWGVLVHSIHKWPQ